MLRGVNHRNTETPKSPLRSLHLRVSHCLSHLQDRALADLHGISISGYISTLKIKMQRRSP